MKIRLTKGVEPEWEELYGLKKGMIVEARPSKCLPDQLYTDSPKKPGTSCVLLSGDWEPID